MVSDKYYNTLKESLTESAANTFTAVDIVWPATLARTSVIEILKVRIQLAGVDLIAATTTGIKIHLALDTNATAVLDLSDKDCIFTYRRNAQAVGARTNEATGLLVSDYSPIEFDFQDNRGYGKILPANEWQLAIQGSNNGSAKTVHIEIDYRVVKVSAQELLDVLETYG